MILGFLATATALLVWLALPRAGQAAWPDGLDIPGRSPSLALHPARPAGTPAAPNAAVGPDRPMVVHYTVLAGDGLWAIARRFGVSEQALQQANGFDGKKVLREGMQLLLPYSNEAGTARYGPGGNPVVNGRGLHFVAGVRQQACWLFRDSVLLEKWTCSTGRPGSPSIPGNYTIQTKIPRAYSKAADFWMPSWLGIYDAGVFENGIHGIPYRAGNGERLWSDLVGTPITFGCVMLEDRLAQKLFDLAYVGMPVTVLQ